MAKRFTATEKWIDPWFCGLTPILKLFWIYLIDNCDHAGIWQVNWPLVKFHLWEENKIDPFLFGTRIIILSPEKWFIPKFIDFQYNGNLNPENRTHASVIAILEKEGAYKGLTRGLQGCKDKGTDKDNTTIHPNKVINHNKEKAYINTKFIAPTLDDLGLYCIQQGIPSNSLEHAKFIDYYQSKGWKVGNAPMKDWRAAWRNWHRKNQGPPAPPASIWLKHPKDCPDCFGNGYETAIGSGKRVSCRRKY